MTPNSTQLANLQEQLTQLQRTIAELQRTPRQPRRILKARSVARETTRPRSNGYRLFDQEFETRNAAETLVQLLAHFAELDTSFPEGFRQAAAALGRSRRYVGRTPKEVYPGRPDLWSQTGEFAPGWYIGTNENNPTKLKLLRCACAVIGLRFGTDVHVWL